jgi:hypothetical protein
MEYIINEYDSFVGSMNNNYNDLCLVFFFLFGLVVFE